MTTDLNSQAERFAGDLNPAAGLSAVPGAAQAGDAKLRDQTRAWLGIADPKKPGLAPAKAPAPIPAKNGTADARKGGGGPGGEGGGIASPLTETAYADRLFYTPTTLISSDGLFTLEVKRIQKIKMTDANSAVVEFFYAAP